MFQVSIFSARLLLTLSALLVSLCVIISSDADAVSVRRIQSCQIGFRRSSTFIPRLAGFGVLNLRDSRDSTSTERHHAQFQQNMSAETEKTFGLNVSLPPRSPKNDSYPPTTLEALRQHFGRRKNFWGDWSAAETRDFYKSHLPWALQVDGALGLSLEERARLASANRHALRLYARERCRLPSRIVAIVYDGLRHVRCFGTWCATGMTWKEVQEKYRKEALLVLGDDADERSIEAYVYKRIVNRACSTSAMFDQIAGSHFVCRPISEKSRSFFRAANGSVYGDCSSITVIDKEEVVSWPRSLSRLKGNGYSIFCSLIFYLCILCAPLR